MKKKKDISDELIFKILNKEASETESQNFQDWINESSKNKKLFQHLEKLWNAPKGLDAYYKIDEKQAWNYIHSKIHPAPGLQIFRNMTKVAAAAALIFLIGTSTLFYIQNRELNTLTWNNEISVKAPLGSKTEVILSDGTKIWLNSGSEIRYPATFDKEQRDVQLVGEAYFEVEKNKKWPFLVHTDDVDIRVLGTCFNVKSYPEENNVETVLEEGSISICKKGSNEVLLLKPDEEAIYTKSTSRFEIKRKIESDLYTSWKSNKIIFKRETFSTLAVKLERWHNVRISIKNKKLAEEKVTGTFENESIEQVLEALRISVPFTYEVRKNNIMIK